MSAIYNSPTDNLMLKASMSERAAEQLTVAQESQRELMRLLFLDAVKSGHDITLAVGQSGRGYPVSELLGEPSKESQKLLLRACSAALDYRGSPSFNAALAAAALRNYINAVAVEYADDFDVL